MADGSFGSQEIFVECRPNDYNTKINDNENMFATSDNNQNLIPSTSLVLKK